MYRLHELHLCACGWFVATTYHLYTGNGNNVIYVYEVFSLEFLVCWRRAWDVLRLRERLSASLADVLRQLSFLSSCHHEGSPNSLWFFHEGRSCWMQKCCRFHNFISETTDFSTVEKHHDGLHPEKSKKLLSFNRLHLLGFFSSTLSQNKILIVAKLSWSFVVRCLSRHFLGLKTEKLESFCIYLFSVETFETAKMAGQTHENLPAKSKFLLHDFCKVFRQVKITLLLSVGSLKLGQLIGN